MLLETWIYESGHDVYRSLIAKDQKTTQMFPMTASMPFSTEKLPRQRIRPCERRQCFVLVSS